MIETDFIPQVFKMSLFQIIAFIIIVHNKSPAYLLCCWISSIEMTVDNYLQLRTRWKTWIKNINRRNIVFFLPYKLKWSCPTISYWKYKYIWICNREQSLGETTRLWPYMIEPIHVPNIFINKQQFFNHFIFHFKHSINLLYMQRSCRVMPVMY